jgi:hypothetical protein
MNDQAIGKRLAEREDLDFFLEAYERATGETLGHMDDSETPDFIGTDEHGRVVGIEITTLRFGPAERHVHSIFPAEHRDGAWCRLLHLMRQKHQTLTRGRWAECERKILVFMMVDASIADTVASTATDLPIAGSFDEIWLADSTQIEAFGAVDLFAVVHPALAGRFATGDLGQKPYG